MKRYKLINLTTDHNPAFLDKLSDHLGKCWCSRGNISCQVNSQSSCHEIMYFPTVRSIFGGPNDGEMVFAGFAFDVNKFCRVFDKRPKIIFDCINQEVVPHFLFEGRIGGEHVKVAILAQPPENQTATETVYAVGPKLGKVETRVVPENH